MKFCDYRKLNTLLCGKDNEICPYLYPILLNQKPNSLWKQCSMLDDKDEQKIPIVKEEDLNIR